MTTIAYKNGILAADRQTTCENLRLQTLKVRRHGKWMAAGCGNTARIHEIHDWIEAGMNPEKLPAFQRDVATCVTMLMVNEHGEMFVLDSGHAKYQIHQPFYAVGSGRDFAMMAMHLGRSAPEAVQLASEFDVHTGMGVDTLTLPNQLDAWRRESNEEDARQRRSLMGDRVFRDSLLQRQHLQEPGGRVPKL